MARTMDQAEQIAVTLLALAYPTRPALTEWVGHIVQDAECVEYAPSVDGEMRYDVRDYAPGISDAEVVEWNMADYRIAALASAVIEHRHGNDNGGLSLALQARIEQRPRGLVAAIVEYTASISEATARLLDQLEDQATR